MSLPTRQFPYLESLAEKAYNAYRDSAHAKAYDGSAIPPWNTVKEPIRVHWLAAAKAVRDAVKPKDA